MKGLQFKKSLSALLFLALSPWNAQSQMGMALHTPATAPAAVAPGAMSLNSAAVSAGQSSAISGISAQTSANLSQFEASLAATHNGNAMSLTSTGETERSTGISMQSNLATATQGVAVEKSGWKKIFTGENLAMMGIVAGISAAMMGVQAAISAAQKGSSSGAEKGALQNAKEYSAGKLGQNMGTNLAGDPPNKVQPVVDSNKNGKFDADELEAAGGDLMQHIKESINSNSALAKQNVNADDVLKDIAEKRNPFERFQGSPLSLLPAPTSKEQAEKNYKAMADVLSDSLTANGMDPTLFLSLTSKPHDSAATDVPNTSTTMPVASKEPPTALNNLDSNLEETVHYNGSSGAQPYQTQITDAGMGILRGLSAEKIESSNGLNGITTGWMTAQVVEHRKPFLPIPKKIDPADEQPELFLKVSRIYHIQQSAF